MRCQFYDYPAITNTDPHTDCFAHAYAVTNSSCNTFTITNDSANSNTYRNSRAVTIANPDANSDSVTDCFAHAYANSDCAVCEHQNLSDCEWTMGFGTEFKFAATGRYDLYRGPGLHDQRYF